MEEKLYACHKNKNLSKKKLRCRNGKALVQSKVKKRKTVADWKGNLFYINRNNIFVFEIFLNKELKLF